MGAGMGSFQVLDSVGTQGKERRAGCHTHLDVCTYICTRQWRDGTCSVSGARMGCAYAQFVVYKCISNALSEGPMLTVTINSKDSH